jgi:GTP cyclohydrolase I
VSATHLEEQMTIRPPSPAAKPREFPESRSVKIDIEGAETAAEALLKALGISLDTDATRRTPARMVSAYIELLTPQPAEVTMFDNVGEHHGWVITRAIPFTSICAHHMLPFVGTAHVGYLPGKRIIGLSKLPRLVEALACRPQVQEELTQQIADWLDHHLGAAGAGVVLTAEHLCLTRRGVRAHGTSTVTTAWRGRVCDDPHARSEFLALAPIPAGWEGR